MKILKNFSFSAFNSVIFSFTQLLLQFYLIKSSNLESYGKFIFTFSVYSIFDVMFTSYNSDISLKRILDYQHNKKTAENNNFSNDTILTLYNKNFYDEIVSSIKFSFLLFILGFFLDIYFDSFEIKYWFLLLPGIIFQSGYNFIKNYHISFNFINRQNIIEVICVIIYGIILFIFFYMWSFRGYVIAYSLYHLSKSIITLKISDFKLSLYRGSFINIKSLLFKKFNNELNVKIFSRNFIVNIYSQLDVIVIGIISSTADIGIYKIAKTISNLQSKLVYPLSIVTRPHIVSAYFNSDKKYFINKIFKIILLYALFGLLFFFIQIIFTEDILSFFYGYLDGVIYKIVFILYFATFFSNLTSPWYFYWVSLTNNYILNTFIIIIQSTPLLFCFFNTSVSLMTFCIYYFISNFLSFMLNMLSVYYFSFISFKFKKFSA